MLQQTFIIQKLIINTLNVLYFLLLSNKSRISGVAVYSKKQKFYKYADFQEYSIHFLCFEIT